MQPMHSTINLKTSAIDVNISAFKVEVHNDQALDCWVTAHWVITCLLAALLACQQIIWNIILLLIQFSVFSLQGSVQSLIVMLTVVEIWLKQVIHRILPPLSVSVQLCHVIQTLFSLGTVPMFQTDFCSNLKLDSQSNLKLESQI